MSCFHLRLDFGNLRHLGLVDPNFATKVEAVNRKNLELISLDMVLIDEQFRFEFRIYFVIFSLLDSHLKTKIVTNKLLI